jgi:eukaryotic-like serine/threonine-protein kinase
MTLSPRTLLGPYEILAPLGAGGMGEVYRARDTRLGRDVAVKVLPPELASDPDRLRRFEQEARAVAALDHPNILSLHDVGTHAGSPYLVTELLEGESLRARLGGGALPPRKAVEVAAQVCSGLAAAHDKGIVHRDLKPENLFLTGEGRVKILDFGLAKLAGGRQAEAAEPGSTVGETRSGTLLGTVPYMSPEQVRGQPADHRSDLFSLGCVLYEMLTGQRAFARDTAADTMSAILSEEPPELTAVRPGVPPPLARVVGHCLEKRPEERFQSARDLAFNLQTAVAAASGEAPSGKEAGGAHPRGRSRERVAWGVALVVAVAAIGALAALARSRRAAVVEPIRFAVTAPEGMSLISDGTALAVSPDGRQLVFTVMDGSGTIRLWLRPLDSLTARPLAGTEGATLPFWSPDGRFVAFFAKGKLRKLRAAGGAPEVICDAADGRGGSWGRDGVIVFAPISTGPLLRVTADGGQPVEVAQPDRSRGENGLRFPCFLPDGRHFLYVSTPRTRDGFDVSVGSLDSGERRPVLSALSAPVYAEPGFLLFALGDRLVAQRFDPSRRQLVGAAVPLGDVPPWPMFDAGATFSASANGVLAHPASSPPATELVWLDRAGRQTGRIPLPPGNYSNPSLSPDGRWATVTKVASSVRNDLWLVDLERSLTTRLTLDGLVAPGWGMAVPVVWSPDSTRVAYCYDRSGVQDVYQIQVNGDGGPQPLVQSEVGFKYPLAWSPDGAYLVFTQPGEAGVYDLWLLPLEGDRTPVPFLRTPFSEDFVAFSPDGRWLAYDSDETGAQEIYVRSFPVPGEKYRVSTSGGTVVQWSSDGRELVFFSLSQYYSGSGPVYAVEVETGGAFRAGTPRVLFTPPRDLSGLVATADLSRFLATVPTEGEAPASLAVTVNWPAALERDGGARP